MHKFAHVPSNINVDQNYGKIGPTFFVLKLLLQLVIDLVIEVVRIHIQCNTQPNMVTLYMYYYNHKFIFLK
jgi:hypothetical protein